MTWLVLGVIYAAYVVGHVRGWSKGKAAGEVAMLSIANTNAKRLVALMDSLAAQNRQLVAQLSEREHVSEERVN